MTTSNTGSLPDLSVLQFPSPLSTPLDQEDPYNTGGTGNSPVSLSPTSPRHMPMSHQNPQSPNQRRRQTSGISLPSPLVLNQIGGQSTSVSPFLLVSIPIFVSTFFSTLKTVIRFKIFRI